MRHHKTPEPEAEAVPAPEPEAYAPTPPSETFDAPPDAGIPFGEQPEGFTTSAAEVRAEAYAERMELGEPEPPPKADDDTSHRVYDLLVGHMQGKHMQMPGLPALEWDRLNASQQEQYVDFATALQTLFAGRGPQPAETTGEP